MPKSLSDGSTPSGLLWSGSLIDAIELPGGKNVRLIAMSGWGQPADRERALAAGIDEHLVKPVDPTRLRELLDRIAKTRTNRGD